jgi:hypothetical protein
MERPGLMKQFDNSARVSRRRLIWHATLGVLGFVLLLGGLTAPANASPAPSIPADASTFTSTGDVRTQEFLRFTNWATVRCLDSNFAGDVYTLGCNGGAYQVWFAEMDRSLVNLATQRCLDSNFAGNVYSLPCNGGDYQKWVPRNRTEVVNVATGRCLDSNFAGNVYTLPCNGGDYQKWVWS